MNVFSYKMRGRIQWISLVKFSVTNIISSYLWYYIWCKKYFIHYSFNYSTSFFHFLWSENLRRVIHSTHLYVYIYIWCLMYAIKCQVWYAYSMRPSHAFQVLFHMIWRAMMMTFVKTVYQYKLYYKIFLTRQ